MGGVPWEPVRGWAGEFSSHISWQKRGEIWGTHHCHHSLGKAGIRLVKFATVMVSYVRFSPVSLV